MGGPINRLHTQELSTAWGEDGPSPLHVGSPRATVPQQFFCPACCQEMCAVLVWLVLVWVCASLCALCLKDCWPLGPAKSWVYIFLGYLLLVWQVACSCATGGGSRGGGVFGPLGTTVPWGVSSESAGRPMGPATLL